ncbi:hypothetical protein PHJA_000727900 [Phtheirospermum japonicum]|uniref:COP1-interacting protein 7 n=1 Tax=Phtheirospermum japonicum TaxID=374723 RepID=A0A830BUT0_9LAMI|nr:hypothetical protein PHJA_000727900 [Phtheirospermum japonicum]
MKQNTRLSSAVFQLTPTRTRCDLIIIANDKKEKIASGLLNPFLAHLKTAQDQVAKGGYSILLEPDKSSNAAWFTKATLERFVRFVSTPEILERVYTIETEILQIEEAITIQSSSDIGENIVENHGRKSLGGYEGGKSLPNANEEKAIVLYMPGETLPEDNGSCSQEGNSRVQLLKVLETRKTVLQKEQEMAFARAVAAGFDIDYMAHLVCFAEGFGAMRLMQACSRFIGLWKGKHEAGQWLNIEASEAFAARSDFTAVNASGIILSDTLNKHDELNHELVSENNGKSSSTNNADNPVPNGQQEYFQGQFPHLVFPPWPMHSPPGAHPVFPAYPLPGMPYYPSYTGDGPFFPPHHYPMEHSSSNFSPHLGQNRQFINVRDSNTGSETRVVDRTRSLDGMASDAEVSHSRRPNKKTGGSNKKQSGKVIIRNMNYITSKENISDSETNSNSQPDTDSENENSDGNDVIHQSKKCFNNDEVAILGKDTDDRHWLAFQDCLLRRSDEGACADNEGMLTVERDVKKKRHNGSASHKLRGSGDEMIFSSAGNEFRGNSDQTDIQFAENNGKKILSRTRNEEFVIESNCNQANFRNLLDPLAVNCFESATNKKDRDFSHRMTDETLVVPFRSMSLDQVGGTDAIDVDSEIPAKDRKLRSEGNRNKVNYEPNDLSLMPERETNKRSTGYDIDLEYEMQVRAQASDKNRRSKVASESTHKQRAGGPVRKAKPSKMSPIEDARARAERLRSYKADLQKLKKEKEEAEAKRLESLKMERQKRIAARVGSNSVKPSTLSPQIKQLPTKLSPTTNRGSKFSDSEPGSSSPLQRSKIRISVGSSESLKKASRGSKLGEGSHMAGNRLSRSLSLLSETKRVNNGVTPHSKASISRIRRLSESKIITKSPVTITKTRSAEPVLKRKLSEGPERNKLSAIIHIDQSKAATLPELKIKTSKSHVSIGENRAEAKDKQKVNGIRPSVFPGNTELNVNNCNTSHQIDSDDNPIVEKTVLVLEVEKPGMRSQQHINCDKGGKSNVISESALIHAPLSPMDGIDKPITCGQKISNNNEVRTVYLEKDPPDSANTSENPYRAPHARVSSFEDPCIHKTEYKKAPLGSTELLSRTAETVKTRVPDVKALIMDKNQVNPEKVSVKENQTSSKGFRRLLRFGKKNQTSSSVDQIMDSECTSGDGIEHDDSGLRVASTSEGDVNYSNLNY